MKDKGLEKIIIEKANLKDLTFAEGYNGKKYALMDLDWIGYYDTIDDLCRVLDIDYSEYQFRNKAVKAITLLDDIYDKYTNADISEHICFYSDIEDIIKDWEGVRNNNEV